MNIEQILKLINRISELVFRSFWYRQIFFIFTTLVAISFIGYHFGTFDQAIHIPFLKKLADPTLYPNDRFFDLQKSHYSYFWYLFIPFYKIGILELVMFIVHIFATYFTFWNIYYLSLRLFNNKTSAFLSVIAFVIPHFTFAGLVLIEFSLLNRTFVLPFLLLAINLYFQRKYLWSFLLLGALYNLHVVSVNFVLAMLIIDSLLLRHKNKLTLVYNFGIFVIGALPVLLWKFGKSSLDLYSRPEWFKLIADGALGHIFRYFLIQPPVILLTFSGIGMIIIFFHSQKYLRSQYQLSLNIMVLTAILIIITDWISTSFYPITIIIQSQIIRTGIFIMIFAYLQLIAILVYLHEQKKLSNSNLLLLFITTVVAMISPFVVAMGIIIKKGWKNIVKYSLVTLMIVFNLVILLIAFKSKLWNPRIQIYPFRNDQNLVQEWAKFNTKKDAIFIAPPYLWGFNNQDWRVVSERMPVVTWSELLEIAFTPEYVPYWKTRFEDISPSTINRFNGDALGNIYITKTAYNSLTQEKFESYGKKYNASYLVVEKPHSFQLPIVYQNANFIVYLLKVL